MRERKTEICFGILLVNNGDSENESPPLCDHTNHYN